MVFENFFGYNLSFLLHESVDLTNYAVFYSDILYCVYKFLKCFEWRWIEYNKNKLFPETNDLNLNAEVTEYFGSFNISWV